jgi:hypothetical protein
MYDCTHVCIHLTLSWNKRMLNGMPKRHQGRKLHSTVKVLWKSSTHVLQPKWTYAQPSHAIWHSCRMRWAWFFTAHNERHLSRCHFAPGPCDASSPMWCAKSYAMMGLGGVGTSFWPSRPGPMWMFAVCKCEKTSLE